MRTLARLILTVRYLVVGLLTLGCGTAELEPDPGSADLVLLHGKILTVDEQLPQVQALAKVGARHLVDPQEVHDHGRDVVGYDALLSIQSRDCTLRSGSNEE